METGALGTRHFDASYSYDRADRLSSATRAGIAAAYTLNANGNTTARGADTFAYDQANRLKTATISGTATTYVYDGDGKRVSTTTGGATTSYVYDVAAGLPLFEGDDRGPGSDTGDRFRVRQAIFQLPSGATTATHREGITRGAGPLTGFERPGDTWLCYAAKSRVASGRSFRVSCSGSIGAGFGFAPPIVTTLDILESETGMARVVLSRGTAYPSLEVWQYGGPGGAPNLLYFFDALRAGTNPYSGLWNDDVDLLALQPAP